MHLIFGLGNPGPTYKQTRHNLGFMILDELARQENIGWEKDSKSTSFVAKGVGYLLVKPQTYMNNSGTTAEALLKYYNLVPRSIFGLKKASDLSSILTVIHDELDLPLGTYKVSVNSSSAGHNGVQSIIDHLKTKNFTRIRIGIGINTENQQHIPKDKFVLQSFNQPELEVIKKLVPKILSNIKL